MPIRGDRLRWPPRPGKRANAARSTPESRGGGTRETLSTDEQKPESRGGGTRETLSTDEQKPAPRQPNERDESADSQASPPRDVIRRAHADVTEGKTDTDCRNEAGEIVERNETRRRNP